MRKNNNPLKKSDSDMPKSNDIPKNEYTLSKNENTLKNPENPKNPDTLKNLKNPENPKNLKNLKNPKNPKNNDIEEDYSINECSENDSKHDNCLTSVKSSILAARYGYIALGSAMAAWASLVPYTKERLDVDESTLGFLLLCLGLGALFSMPVAGALTTRYGCKKLQNICLPIYYISLILLTIVPNPWTLAIILTVFGAMSGMLDVVMNLQVVFLEKISGKRMMSSLHAMYTVGVAVGAGGIALLYGIGLSPFSAVLSMGTFFLVMQIVFFGKHFYPFGGNKRSATGMLLPKGSLLILGVICYILYMIEGVIMDWSALFMNLERNIPVAEAGLAYGLFAITMAIARLFGDRLGESLGAKNLLIVGCVVASIGFFMLSFIDSAVGSYFSFFLIGIGAANTIPLLFTIASKQKGIDVSAGIAAVSTIGYMGLLSGPAFMGFVAEYFGLPRIFFLMAVFVGIMAIVSIYIKEE